MSRLPVDLRYGLLRVAALARDEVVTLATQDPNERLIGSDLRNAIEIATDALDTTNEGAEATLRYALRMGGRATPFGLFAGTAPVALNRDRQLGIGRGQARVRVDVNVLETLLTSAGLDACVRTNPSLHEIDGVFRFQATPGAVYSSMVELTATPAVRLVADFALTDRTEAEIARMLLSYSPGLDESAARTFITGLLDAELLIRETVVVRPGVEPVDLAHDYLTAIEPSAAHEALNILTRLTHEGREIDGLSGRLHQGWHEATKLVEDLSAITAGERFHIDLEFSGSDLSIDTATVNALEQTLDLLAMHCTLPDPLKDFKQRFTSRYEDSEVPLLEALDIDRGVADQAARRASQFAKDAGVGPGSSVSADEFAVPAVALTALSHWMTTGESPDLMELPLGDRIRSSRVPTSVLASLIGQDNPDFDAVFLQGTGHASQSLNARFALSRPELSDIAVAYSQAEQRALPADHVLAEVSSHMPGRIGNVEIRPLLPPETIDLFGSGGGTLRLSDLALSVINDRILLRHVPTDRWVMPNLTSSVNPDQFDAPHVYRFLASLCGANNVAWTWGQLRELPHLPRVVSGRVIVAPETWNVERSLVRSGLAQSDALAWLRELPNMDHRRWFGITMGDQVMPFNLDLPATVHAAFERQQHGSGTVTISELAHVEHPAAQGPNGRHVAELALPVPGHSDQPVHHERPAVRPDQDWLSTSLYCSNADADGLVHDAARFAGELCAAGIARSWFFIRFADPQDHLRFRVLPTSGADRPAVAAAIDSWVQERMRSRQIASFTSTPYRPEITRYGGPSCLPLCEEVFRNDSEAVARQLRASDDEAHRLYAVVNSILQWTALLPDPLEFIKCSIEGYWTEFERTGKNKIGALFNEHRDELQSHIASNPASPDLLVALKAVAENLDGRVADGVDQPITRFRVFNSLVHMHANRMFRTDQRRQELVAYELAKRVLVSTNHRARTK